VVIAAVVNVTAVVANVSAVADGLTCIRDDSYKIRCCGGCCSSCSCDYCSG
jgi:hypothetical protein